MKVVAFIPARYQSTRLPGKPLKDIGGKPMIQWVSERTALAKSVETVSVATDDERIREAVEAYGGNVVMTSSSCLSGTERVAEAARDCGADIIVNVQGDEPLVEPALIDDLVAPMLADSSIGLATPATLIKTEAEYLDTNTVKVVLDREGNALYFSRSPIPNHRDGFRLDEYAIYKHIGLYVYRREVLEQLAALAPTPLERAEGLEQLRALEHGIKIRVVMTTYSPESVDTPEDLERVRAAAAGLS
ncbi:3-deoxy-manno-octulosonate cytidylyltransferase [hydrothermal vent metagenome]|uniref:3-deoxy-manno-octulosonate cytidylyltransferase n=1 Tax=hydrothermal vent metagenome TaxID=652676 RepID=A0A3B0QQE3_9ZZZZ